jgi:hypothetical protein
MQNRESQTWCVDDLVTEMEAEFSADDASVGVLEWWFRRSIQQNNLFDPTENLLLDGIVDPG